MRPFNERMNTMPTELTTLLTGLTIGESPRWHDGRLWLCNWGPGEVIALDTDGHSEVVHRVETRFQFSIDWLPDGRMLVVRGAECELAAFEADGPPAPYADLHAVSAKGWNELVVDARGNAYVNGGGFDIMAGEPPAPAHVALATPDGATERVATGLEFPNGMAITPNGSVLIVADSYARQLTAYDIAADGSLSPPRVWAALGDGVPDGICVDETGAVWYADVPNKRCVRVREGGEVLDTVVADRGCFACMLGGDDGRTLFIAAAEWRGMDAAGGGPPSGVVFATRAPAAHAGCP
jgi:sugar lactone lactonase YvrE